ncbi:hypothetical protein [Haloarcula nitratireducens]|uniref:Uncharacterized protein n=1 Tax=Haloarcula nitratireducens TaxID=2487749 RepID=A0AAW4P7L1_9EURY|nr:hypothetical protein [Halomicroarcula nitratireducens]MBX0293752.1 hypothetical protein [Halomicroarcula nitratireducens]
MADDKSGRDKQARDAERRQRERDVVAELERGDETEPPVDPAELDDFEAALDAVEFPATGSDVVAAVGDRTLTEGGESYTVEELVPDTDEERFSSTAAVRMRVQRPRIAAAMKRIVEASDSLPNVDLGTSQREAYEKTFRELKAIDEDDEDEGIRVIGDWIVERIHEKEKLPGSRDVRRQAAKFCRKNGYSVRNDEWLGV